MTVENDKCAKDFLSSGYKAEELEKLKEKAIARSSVIREDEEETESLIFPLHFFDKKNLSLLSTA